MALKNIERRIVNIGKIEVKDVDYSKKYRYDDIKIDSSKVNLFYLIHHVDYFSNEYDMNHLDVLMVIYLYELGIFSRDIEVGENNIRLDRLSRLGLVEDDFSINGKKLMSLSATGIMMVRKISKRIMDNDKYISINRKTIIDDDSRARAVINKYLKENTKTHPY